MAKVTSERKKKWIKMFDINNKEEKGKYRLSWESLYNVLYLNLYQMLKIKNKI